MGVIESSGGILEDTIDFMTGIERVVKCTKEGRYGEGKMRRGVWRRGQTNGKGREIGKTGRNPGRRLLSLLKSRHAKNVRYGPTTETNTAPLESQFPYRYGVEMEEWLWLSYDPGLPSLHLFEERILTSWNNVH